MNVRIPLARLAAAIFLLGASAASSALVIEESHSKEGFDVTTCRANVTACIQALRDHYHFRDVRKPGDIKVLKSFCDENGCSNQAVELGWRRRLRAHRRAG